MGRCRLQVLNSSNSIALGDFRTEVAILRRVHHPNAVQMLGACTKSVPYMLVTEFVPGGPLSSIFSTRLRISLRRIVEIALDIARGMAYLHSASKAIIHRDLKPSNILIGGSYHNSPSELALHTGVIKIGDFGLSKSLATLGNFPGANSNEAYNLTGGTGSYRYMAPEVFRHEPYSSKVDVYSFAMIVYQLIEGVVPFHGTKPMQAAVEVSTDQRRPDWSTLYQLERNSGDKLRSLVEQCWTTDPQERPSFEEICEFLEHVLKDIPRDPEWSPKRDAARAPEAEAETKCQCAVM